MVTLSCFTQIVRPKLEICTQSPASVSGTLVSKLWSNQLPHSFFVIVKQEVMDSLSMYYMFWVVLSVAQHKVESCFKSERNRFQNHGESLKRMITQQIITMLLDNVRNMCLSS